MTTDTTSVANPAIQFVAAHEKTVKVVPGRRDWVEYRDFGVAGGTNGRMRAERGTVNGKPELTGWHYHECEMQFFYLLNGSITLELENGETVVLERGDSALIPGGFRHSETAVSEDFDFIEISIPGDMGTVPCSAPDIWREKFHRSCVRGYDSLRSERWRRGATR